MIKLIKYFVATAFVSNLALSAAVFANEDLKHKTVEIKAIKGENVNIMVGTNGNSQTIVISQEELANSELLAKKLTTLDDETKETVLEALEGLSGQEKHGPTKMKNGNMHKVIVINKDDDQLLKKLGDEDLEIEIDGDNKHIIRKHIILEDDSHEVLQNHTNAITTLIDHGEFSQKELDQIEAALDAKRATQ